MKEIMKEWRLYLNEGVKFDPNNARDEHGEFVKPLDEINCVELPPRKGVRYRARRVCIPKEGAEIDFRSFDTRSIDVNDSRYAPKSDEDIDAANHDQDLIRSLYDKFSDRMETNKYTIMGSENE